MPKLPHLSVPPPFTEVKVASINGRWQMPATKSGNEQQANLMNFRALKKLEEETIYKNAEKRHQDNLSCDYDTSILDQYINPANPLAHRKERPMKYCSN
jgi:cysteine synthase